MIVPAVNIHGTSNQTYQLHVLPNVGVDDPNQRLPDKFDLVQNYPNPFNPATNIRYAVHDRSKVRLAIYNLLGQEIRTLVNEIQGPGHKQINWDGKNNKDNAVSSGLYLYRLQAGDFVQIKKMLFLK